jgi:hypothetical protein
MPIHRVPFSEHDLADLETKIGEVGRQGERLVSVVGHDNAWVIITEASPHVEYRVTGP